jgi:hypothetical protein
MNAELPPLPLADRYASFRGAVFDGVEEELPGLEVPASELEVQSQWFGGAFGDEAVDAEGRRVRVVDFGEWNAGAGPDFTGCAVEIDGELRRGDIELDLDVRDWERHGHGANPAFAGVVLHLYLQAPAGRFFTRTCEHREVSQVQLDSARLSGRRRGPAPARLGRCHRPLAAMEPARVWSLLESAAQFRLERKSRRLHRSVRAKGREQAVYQELARGLGYHRNAQPFYLLAQRLPVRRLLRLPAEERESLLFGVAGFLGRVRHESTEGDSRQYLRRLWQAWWRQIDAASRWLEPEQLPHWQLTGSRPGNHPQRRLGALAALLGAWERVAAPLLDVGRWSRAAWRETLLGLEHPHWSCHYTLTSAPAAAPLALIGDSRVQELLANVVYPLLVPERTRLWAEYLELPAQLDNHKLRRAAQRLFGPGPRPEGLGRRLFHQQGLLQVYEDFCLEDDSGCRDCPFPERLGQWA